MGDNVEDSESDAIGDTVYSKKWLIETMLKLVEFIKNESQTSQEENLDEIDDKIEVIEDELCILWDISSNEHVQTMLIDYNGLEILIDAVLITNCPRLAEISVGILANLAHNQQIYNSISANKHFCGNIIDLLSSSDIPFLIQVLRFLNTIFLYKQHEWLFIIEQHSSTFFNNIRFLLFNCLNEELLKILIQFINNLLYFNEHFGKLWLKENEDNTYISSLCHGCFQIVQSYDQVFDSDSSDFEWSIISSQDRQFFYYFWFIIQISFDLESNVLYSEFCDNITELEELFYRFYYYLDDSLNSISSYSAACLVFSSLRELSNGQKLSEKESKLIQSTTEKILKNRSAKNVCSNVCQLCTEKIQNPTNEDCDAFELALKNVKMFFND